MGDARPFHHACAVQQWRHHLTSCVKVSGEHSVHLNPGVFANNNVKLHCLSQF